MVSKRPCDRAHLDFKTQEGLEETLRKRKKAETQNLTKIGVIACEVFRREMETALKSCPEAKEVIFLPSSLTFRPHELKKAVVSAIDKIKDSVDGIFLGYADCKSLKGIEDKFDITIVHPKSPSCIPLLLGQERYDAEMKKEQGTWFMTPGWTDITPESMISDMGLDKFEDSHGVSPKELIDMAFESYRRGLFIDTEVSDSDLCQEQAGKICKYLNLNLETTSVKSNVLQDGLKECLRLSLQRKQK